MVTELDPLTDCLISVLGPALQSFRDFRDQYPQFVPIWLVEFEALMDWLEENQIPCAVTYEYLGHGRSNNRQVVHVRILVTMDEKTATVFRLYRPDEKFEQL